MDGSMRGLWVLTPGSPPDVDLTARSADPAVSGHFAPIIDRRIRLENAADAIPYPEVRHARDRVVTTTAWGPRDRRGRAA
jgi:hypothetical protein